MAVDASRFDEIKRKVRKLKQLEVKIRFNGINQPDRKLIWDKFFDLHGADTTKAKYSLHMLVSMNHEEYKNVIDEYFAHVYYELYKENGMTGIQGIYDPDILAKLGLQINSNENDIKKRFRELAKKYHPDAGGDAGMFIELMENYKKLIERGR